MEMETTILLMHKNQFVRRATWFLCCSLPPTWPRHVQWCCKM